MCLKLQTPGELRAFPKAPHRRRGNRRHLLLIVQLFEGTIGQPVILLQAKLVLRHRHRLSTVRRFEPGDDLPATLRSAAVTLGRPIGSARLTPTNPRAGRRLALKHQPRPTYNVADRQTPAPEEIGIRTEPSDPPVRRRCSDGLKTLVHRAMVLALRNLLFCVDPMTLNRAKAVLRRAP